MPLIPKQVKHTREALTVKLERELLAELRFYAEFIDSTQEYVVNEALARTFRRDKEFQAWLEKKGARVGGNGT